MITRLRELAAVVLVGIGLVTGAAYGMRADQPRALVIVAIIVSCLAAALGLWLGTVRSIVFGLVLSGLAAVIAVAPAFVSSDSTRYASSASSLSGGAFDCGPLVKADATMWGPERPMYTRSSPASEPVLNSIADQPQIGDERGFMSVMRTGKDRAGDWCRGVYVADGDVVLIRLIAHNSAGCKFDADGTRIDTSLSGVRLVMAETAGQGPRTRYITASLYASNSSIDRVWAAVKLSADGPLHLQFVTGSGRLYSNVPEEHGQGRAVGESVTSLTGQMLGAGVEDGVLPCDNLGNVTFTVQAKVIVSQ
ncbi:MAG: hypothetical protein WBB41_01145 [Candidatus Nanopelagicales bacterium]